MSAVSAKQFLSECRTISLPAARINPIDYPISHFFFIQNTGIFLYQFAQIKMALFNRCASSLMRKTRQIIYSLFLNLRFELAQHIANIDINEIFHSHVNFAGIILFSIRD